MIAASRRAVLSRAALTAASMAAVGLGLGSVPRPAMALLSREAPPEVLASLPGVSAPRGTGRLNFLGLHIYDARLWVAAGFDASAYERVPLALELAYARKLNGAQIADRSLQEMQRLGALAPEQASAWRAEMGQAFPDVVAGDRITGLLLPGEGARFHLNGALRREVRDVEFARRFFGIWLAPQTSQPRLREALLGQRA